MDLTRVPSDRDLESKETRILQRKIVMRILQRKMFLRVSHVIFTIFTCFWILGSMAFSVQEFGGKTSRILLDVVIGLVCILLPLLCVVIPSGGSCRGVKFVVDTLSLLLLFTSYAKKLETRVSFYVICHLLQMCRLGGVHFAFVEFERKSICRYKAIRLTKITLVLLSVIHSFTCLFHCLGGLTMDAWIIGDISNPGLVAVYVNTVYWCVTTIFAVGYGDYTPKNTIDKLFVTMFMVSNIIPLTYVVVNLTGFFADAPTRVLKFKEKLQLLRRLSKSDGISYLPDMQDLELECSLHYEQIGHNDLIRSLPDTLKEKIKEKAYRYLIRNRLFAVIPRHVLFHLILQMSSECVPSDHVIVVSGDESTSLLLLLWGSVDVTRTTHVQHVVEGNLLGESAFIINAIHEETIRTRQRCHLVRLDRTVFLNVIRKYPGTGMEIINRFHQIHHDLQEDINSKILEGSLDDYFTVVDAIDMDDWPLARRLIMRGIDGGKCIRGSTPLINAAKKGKTDIVRLLLKHGANPNVTDTSDGNSALHYAAINVEKDMALLLLKYGASKTLINKMGHTPMDVARRHRRFAN